MPGFPDSPNAFNGSMRRRRRFGGRTPGFAGVGDLTRYIEKYGPKLQSYYGKLTGKETSAPEPVESEPVIEAAEPAPASVAGVGIGTLALGALALWILFR